MTSEEIKSECDLMYKQISDANIKLQDLRNICNHTNTFESNWSWRVGSSSPAIICSDCGQLIKYVNDFVIPIVITNI